MKFCALEGCGKRLQPLIHKVAGLDEEYCSPQCRDVRWEETYGSGRRKKREKDVQVKAKEFGGAHVVRRKCDRCGAQIIWEEALWTDKMLPGKEFCSHKCLMEKDNEMNATEETTTPSPIVGGTATAAAPKKAAKTAAKAAKKAPAKKAAAPKKAAKAPKEAKAKSNGNGKGRTWGGGFDVFAEGSKKQKIAEVLKDGKYHLPEELKKLCDKMGTNHRQVLFTTTELAERGGLTVTVREADGAIRVTK